MPTYQGKIGRLVTLIVGSQSLRAMNVTFDPDVRSMEPEAAIGYLQEMPPKLAGRYGKLDFELDLRGSGAAGTAPIDAAIMKACGLKETIVAVTSCKYQATNDPTTDTTALLTAAIYDDALFFSLTNLVGNVVWTLEAGKLAKIAYTLLGCNAANPTEAAAPGHADPGTLGPPTVVQSATLSMIGSTYIPTPGTVYKVPKLIFDVGNTAPLRDRITATGGYDVPAIIDRNSVAKVVVEVETIGSTPKLDVYGAFDARTPIAVSCALGSGAGNVATFTLTGVMAAKPVLAIYNGLKVWEFDLAVDPTTAANNLALTWT